MRSKPAAISAAISGGAISKLIGNISLAALAFALCAPPAFAATGELWETTMNIPGMPAGMGGMTQKMCRDKDDVKSTANRKDMKDCTVSDVKQTATRSSFTMTCKDSKSYMEFNYNANRTEYKATMRTTSKKDGEMTMTMSGRKIGDCDAQEAKAERDAKVAGMMAEADRRKAESNKMLQQSDDKLVQDCNNAVTNMDGARLQQFGRCAAKSDAECKKMQNDLSRTFPKASEVCPAKATEFCRRYQTTEGFVKAGDRRRYAAEMCGVSVEKVRASLCPGAMKSQSYDFIGGFCPEEAKPLVKEHCAGRAYTEGLPNSVEKKWLKFCTRTAAREGGDEESAASETPKKRAAESKKPVASEESNPKKAAGDAVNQGINKLKGLFGR